MEFPRLQIAIACGIWLLLWILLSRNLPAGLLWVIAIVLCMTYQWRWIWPNTSLCRKSVLDATEADITHNPTLKLLTSNVLTSNRQSQKLVDLVEMHRPDILATLESDQWWQDKLDTLAEYPHRMACPLDNLIGMHLYSRLPLQDSHIEYLVEDDVPSFSTNVIVENDRIVRLHIVHPTPPAPNENSRSTERDVELLILAKTLGKVTNPTIVAGDLNDVAWSETNILFRKISGLLDPRIGRGFFNTFHAGYWMLRWPLDHFFVSSQFKVIQMQRMPTIGSDHFPIMIELALLNYDVPADRSLDAAANETRLRETLDTEVAKNANTPTVNESDS
jgi:endonuclease/exonuclease/phosphatase (EEP) superfamily protein YafD